MFVSCVAASPVCSQMLPSFAYTSVPATSIPGSGVGTMTTFDGVGVRAGMSSLALGPAVAAVGEARA